MGTERLGLDEVDGAEERDGAETRGAESLCECDGERVDGAEEPLFVRFDRVVREAPEELRDGLVLGPSELERRSMRLEEPFGEERRVVRLSPRGDRPSSRRLSKLPRSAERLELLLPRPSESNVRPSEPLRPSGLLTFVRGVLFGREASYFAR